MSVCLLPSIHQSIVCIYTSIYILLWWDDFNFIETLIWYWYWEDLIIYGFINQCPSGWLCILRHQGSQLILAYRCARPAILVAGKSRGGNVFISSISSLSFLFLCLPCSSLSSLLLSLLSLFSLSLGDDTKWPTRDLLCLPLSFVSTTWIKLEVGMAS